MRLSIAAAALALLAAATADEVFVDEGACPGEGCVYGEEWVAREPIELHARPDESSSVVGKLAPREQITTLTGEVHSRPGRYRVKQAHDDLQPGDEVLLYTYLGEGWYRARHNGVLRRLDLGFSPWDRRCRSEDDSRCRGFVERPVEFWWWVRVRNTSGVEGWVLDSRALEKPGLH